jgi:HPt (histidine-containing phosphotransfer) domain-containing protein
MTQASCFDLDDAVKHCFGKYTMFQQMADCLFDEADPLVEQMRAALAAGQATELGNAAHRLKGTVAYLGAAPALDATRAVEQKGKSGELMSAGEAIQRLEQQLLLLKEELAPHRSAAGT